MAILVTGGGGFIGSHLVEHLLEHTERDILVLDDFSTGRRVNLERVHPSPRVEIQEGDVRDEAVVRDAVVRADAVYHLAASVGVENVVEDPLESLETNVEGTKYILDAAAQGGVPVFVASSSEVYGKSTDLPFSETGDRVLGPTTVPRWGYATAKALDEFYALAHHETNDLPVVVARFFNIVGPRQVGDYGMVIPTFVDQALADEPLTVYGDGTQTRSFTHVEDAVTAAVDIMNEPDADGEIFNVGSGEQVSINELAERVRDLVGSNSDVDHVPLTEAFDEDFEEPDGREPDVSKLRDTIDWWPTHDLDCILEDVIAERSETIGENA